MLTEYWRRVDLNSCDLEHAQETIRDADNTTRTRRGRFGPVLVAHRRVSRGSQVSRTGRESAGRHAQRCEAALLEVRKCGMQLL